MSEMTRLTSLELRGMEIAVLPEHIGFMRALKLVVVSQAGLAVLPGRLSRCVDLETLRADRNALTSLDRNIFKGSLGPNLHSLVLYKNKLEVSSGHASSPVLATTPLTPRAKSLPDMARLVALTLLDCSDNSIKVFPNGFGAGKGKGLDSLRVCKMARNRMTRKFVVVPWWVLRRLGRRRWRSRPAPPRGAP